MSCSLSLHRCTRGVPNRRSPADAERSALGVGTAARTDASEAAVSTNAIVPVAAPTAENFKRASDYSGRHGGRDVLVMVDGKIVFERYDNGPKRFFDCCFAVGCAALMLVLNSPDIATADAAERPALFRHRSGFKVFV